MDVGVGALVVGVATGKTRAFGVVVGVMGMGMGMGMGMVVSEIVVLVIFVVRMSYGVEMMMVNVMVERIECCREGSGGRSCGSSGCVIGVGMWVDGTGTGLHGWGCGSWIVKAVATTDVVYFAGCEDSQAG